ncbi:hypothetical protein PILCRDRAFT_826589 [Piloderma croceum F 1598]|uniref:Uncharacterized protein n=1 Tax=Piloderma croceum (strain F 1598) TaxID=765440 RepID=A0A0C3AQN1_PILCF|nr:hypothetical protein PILCRDRAFT_826589 [Piloderma croceum F 1598]
MRTSQLVFYSSPEPHTISSNSYREYDRNRSRIRALTNRMGQKLTTPQCPSPESHRSGISQLSVCMPLLASPKIIWNASGDQVAIESRQGQ